MFPFDVHGSVHHNNYILILSNLTVSFNDNNTYTRLSFYQTCFVNDISVIYTNLIGFGGLEVACWPLVQTWPKPSDF